jgi:hypothetical protein
MISAFRTLVVSPDDTCGVTAWPLAGSTETLDYSLDCSALMADAGDTITIVGIRHLHRGARAKWPCWRFDHGLGGDVLAHGGIAGRNYSLWCDIQTGTTTSSGCSG